MELYYKDNLIILKDSKNMLLPKHHSQLIAFGFENVDGIWVSGQEDAYNLSMKIINYFNKKDIKVSIDEEARKIIEDGKNRNDKFTNRKIEAANFKNGVYDETNFQEFINFTKSALARKLKDHQIKAAYHHFILKNGANFSVPGSGKTSVILTIYEKMRLDNDINILFIVGPTSSFSAWRTEYNATLGREPSFVIQSGGNRDERIIFYNDLYNFKYDMIITSFNSFCNDKDEIEKFFKAKHNKVFLVIDEAHYIKRINGIWAQALLQNAKYAKARYILTGTPCPKSYTDMFNLFDFLWFPEKPLTDSEKIEIKTHEKDSNFSAAEKILKKGIEPLFYRVRKCDLGLAEPLFHQPIIIKMNLHERRVYDSIYKRLTELSFYDNNESITTLLQLKRGRIMRLRQLTSYTKLLKTAIGDYNEEIISQESNINEIIYNYDKYELPAKTQEIINLIASIRKKDRKILIWSNFIGTIKLIKSVLEEKFDCCCNAIYGEIKPISFDPEEQSREKIINEFLSFDSNLDILIANPGACAESISLHKSCFNAIYYDISYNCAQYLQSLDRIHRVGGSENKIANYYFLQYENTIDSDIMQNLLKKKEKMYNVIENDFDIYSLDIEVFDNIDEDIAAYDRIFKNEL